MGIDNWQMAVLRWEAYSGRVVLPTCQTGAQARKDRERYGAEYYECGANNSIVSNPYRLIRFTTEVCGLTYTEALAHLMDINSETLPFHGGDEPSLGVAEEMLIGTGNIPECIWLARFYSHMAMRRGSPDAANGWKKLIPVFERCRVTTVTTRP